MNWKPYKQGQLAKCNHGYYFVYQKFHHEVGSNRWFIKYEPGTHAFGEKATLTGNPRGFKTLEEARAYSEKNAEDTERALERFGPNPSSQKPAWIWYLSLNFLAPLDLSLAKAGLRAALRRIS